MILFVMAVPVGMTTNFLNISGNDVPLTMEQKSRQAVGDAPPDNVTIVVDVMRLRTMTVNCD
ncbi:MAG: hypothetical protein DRN17_06020, partial [Thermoplasmata archaeon]